jgi:hypothetical protein
MVVVPDTLYYLRERKLGQPPGKRLIKPKAAGRKRIISQTQTHKENNNEPNRCANRWSGCQTELVQPNRHGDSVLGCQGQ